MTGSELSQAKDSRHVTVWRVWTLPRQDGTALLLHLTTPSNDPAVIDAIEQSAALAGMSITRLDADAEGSASPAAVPEEET